MEIPINKPSLCIPRINPDIKEAQIRKIINGLNIGIIERIDIVKKITKREEDFNRAFIHFKKWNTNENAVKARERVINGNDIKVIYDEPWYWKISAYKYKEPEPKPKVTTITNTNTNTNLLQIKKPELKRDIACNRKNNGDPVSPLTPKSRSNSLEIEQL